MWKIQTAKKCERYRQLWRVQTAKKCEGYRQRRNVNDTDSEEIWDTDSQEMWTIQTSKKYKRCRQIRNVKDIHKYSHPQSQLFGNLLSTFSLHSLIPFAGNVNQITPCIALSSITYGVEYMARKEEHHLSHATSTCQLNSSKEANIQRGMCLRTYDSLPGPGCMSQLSFPGVARPIIWLNWRLGRACISKSTDPNT